MATDVTIRGAGIMGLCVAWVCAQRGARVHIIDPGGCGAGASGGFVGALAPHVPENWNAKKAFQLDSLLMAQDFWADIAQYGRDPGYARTGRLQPIMDEAGLALARTRGQSAAQLWGGLANWQITRDVPDWAMPSPTGHWIFDDLSAQLHPRAACAALAHALLVHRGIEIVPDGREHGAVIWATGVAGLDMLSQGAPRAVGTAVKGQAALLACDRAGAPQLFVDGLHVIAHLDGTVAVGSTSENGVRDLSVDAQLERVIARARAGVPDLRAAAVIGRWAGLRPRARSRAPLLGAWPGRTGHFIANGGFKIGFGMAPKIAQLMADLVLEGRDCVPEAFSLAASS